MKRREFLTGAAATVASVAVAPAMAADHWWYREPPMEDWWFPEWVEPDFYKLDTLVNMQAPVIDSEGIRHDYWLGQIRAIYPSTKPGSPRRAWVVPVRFNTASVTYLDLPE